MSRSVLNLKDPINWHQTLYRKYLAHSVGGCSADVFAEFVERFQISFVQCISDDLDVHFIQILFRDAVHEEGGCRKTVS